MFAAMGTDSEADVLFVCAASMHAVAVRRINGLHMDSPDDPDAAEVMQRFKGLVRGSLDSSGCVGKCSPVLLPVECAVTTLDARNLDHHC